jgi:serine/threonine protein kinase
MNRPVLDERYALDDLPIGRGGMGEVWGARDLRLDRRVAIKLIRFPDGTPDPELVRRFHRESRITARLEHPGVPAVHDTGVAEDGRPYLVMQYVDGISVADVVAEQGPLPIGWAAAIAAQACAVLAAAHAVSLVHRDLKPANLVLGPDGAVRVLDFGLAVALGAGDSQITRSGQTVGTPAYMAPELVIGEPTGPATDLYSLGCTLHEMLTGRSPFRASTAHAVMNQQVEQRPPGVRRDRPDVPLALEALVLALLAKDPGDRACPAEHVYDRLLPFVHDRPALPGVTSSEPDPVQLYAAVVGGVRGVPTTIEVVPSYSRPDLSRVRAEAAALVRRSRHSEAADVLSAALDPAASTLGPAHADVVSLRLALANVQFDRGDYRSARTLYRGVAGDVADTDVALRCRRQEATCAALAGDVPAALRLFEAVLHDARQRYGDDDPQVVELRREIALLDP